MLGYVAVQPEPLLSRRRGIDARTSEPHADVAPCEPGVMKKMAGRFVTERAVFARVDFTFCDDERRESVCPDVELGKCILMSRQIVSLVVAVRFVFSKLNVLP